MQYEANILIILMFTTLLGLLCTLHGCHANSGSNQETALASFNCFPYV